jgi:DNA polymerase bacteriophage-type
MPKLHLDIETYSSIDIRSCGVYRYVESPDFEILMIAYAFDDDEVQVLSPERDMALREFAEHLTDPNIEKWAHNATFERLAFKAVGITSPADQWHCTAVKSAYCGLPLSLAGVSEALNLGEQGKLSTGKALIKYFCVPCKPTNVNGGRTRNYPEHDPEKWEQFKEYCIGDVVAEREIERLLSVVPIPESERQLYILDQVINDRGIEIDKRFVECALKIDNDASAIIEESLKDITGLDNPNSAAQLKDWIGDTMDEEITTLAKGEVLNLLQRVTEPTVREVLLLRQKFAKTSTKKYVTMLNAYCDDGRAHGLFQFYGANRTGRWAGRLIQMQNLPQNHLDDLDLARQMVRTGVLDNIAILYDDVPDTLSQLIRTAFVAPEGKTFAVADFSAIEARVIAWLAGEEWRMKVFNSHGKIYEASAATMFGVAIEEVTKGSTLRQKGKIAELALGYQGGVSALQTMGGERMGLTVPEMKEIVIKWRKANPAIVQLWKDLDLCAKEAVRKPGTTITSSHQGLKFKVVSRGLCIRLPSGRMLFYVDPILKKKTIRPAEGEPFETESITYMGMDQVRKQWTRLDTYGGKLAENIVQAIARDLLAEAMLTVAAAGYKIVMHVHDEIVAEVADFYPEVKLKQICALMTIRPSWAEDLPLGADGYLTKYYKKD